MVAGTAILPANARIDVNVSGSPVIANATVLPGVISATTLSSNGRFAPARIESSAVLTVYIEGDGLANICGVSKKRTLPSATGRPPALPPWSAHLGAVFIFR